MNLRKLTNPLLRLSYWQFRLATRFLGDPETQNRFGLSATHWLTPFVERSGYEWRMHHTGVNLTINAANAAGGRVTKVISPPEYDLTKKVKGGRVTKTMPRQLKKIKEGQESVDS